MTKNLSERITSRLNTIKNSQRGRNRALFLALSDDIRKALNDGWTKKAIWETLRAEGKIDFGYVAFLDYVRQFIRNDKRVSGHKGDSD